MKFVKHSHNYCHNANIEHEIDVQSGLSYTPSEMLSMTARGSAISLDTLSGSASYDVDETFAMPFELIRGVDMNDAWEMQRHSSEVVNKFKDGVNGAVSKGVAK